MDGYNSECYGIAEMTTSLSRLLRSIAKDNRRLMPLKDELSLLDDYFLIQKYRYGSTVSMVKEIDNEELLTYLIPRFTLQPWSRTPSSMALSPKAEEKFSLRWPKVDSPIF